MTPSYRAIYLVSNMSRIQTMYIVQHESLLKKNLV